MVELAATSAQISALLTGRPMTQYTASQVLFYRGHVPAGLWVLSDGEVVLREDGRILSYIVAPALLGLKELLTATPYPTTGQAMTACQVTFIGKEELAPLLARPPLSDLIGAS